MNERILLHLRRYYTAKKEVEAPVAVTQKGIADAIDIRVTHVPRSVKKLEEEGLIYESVMHVEGLDKRRKAYFLTEKGMYSANKIKEGLEGRNVTFRDLNGNVKNIKIAELRNITGINLGLLDFVRLIDREGILNQSSMEQLAQSTKLETPGKESMLFDFPQKVPITEEFLGRKEETGTLNDWITDDEIVLISVHGDAGIGKTSLVANSLFKFKDEISIFWFGFEKKEEFEDMIDHLSEFFFRLNRAELKNVLRSKEKGLGEILKVLSAAICGTSTLLVFDTLDEADEKSKRFFSLLFQSLDDLSGAKIIILHRGNARLYVQDAVNSKHFKDLRLEGLDRKSARTLLGVKTLKKDEFDRIFKLTEGNPRLLKLVKSEEILELEKTGKYTADELMLIRYLKSLDKI